MTTMDYIDRLCQVAVLALFTAACFVPVFHLVTGRWTKLSWQTVANISGVIGSIALAIVIIWMLVLGWVDILEITARTEHGDFVI